MNSSLEMERAVATAGALKCCSEDILYQQIFNFRSVATFEDWRKRKASGQKVRKFWHISVAFDVTDIVRFTICRQFNSECSLLPSQVGRRRRDSGASGTSESDGESHSESEMVRLQKPSRPIHILRKRKQKRKMSFIFAVFYLMLFGFDQCEGALKDSCRRKTILNI